MEEVPTQEQINSLVPVPKESLEIDQEKAHRWVEAETDPEYQAIKRKITRRSIDHTGTVHMFTIMHNANLAAGVPRCPW